MKFHYDVVVIGAGHAGIEACLASARLNQRTLLVTTNVDRIGYMSCNPSIGGLAKGHMVREIDVLGGEMGIAADETCIQFKRLNANKGPAVRGTRVQSDKHKYSQYMKSVIASTQNLEVLQSEVKALKTQNDKCIGVVLEDGSEILSKTTIITTGTFMNGVMHMGNSQVSGGRVGDKASVGLSDQLKSFGFSVHRLKTGTPARLYRDSIDWSLTEPQEGDPEFFPFSLRSASKLKLPQVKCYLSRTTPETHQIIRENLHLSPMYCGIIEGVGPRYCPSIEDKIVRFAAKDSHQTFLEPEGLDTDLIYLQGISTSLPVDVQDKFLRTIIGLKDVKVARYGYAVEYDFVEPTQIWHRLESRPLENLFLAGQVNGTSGYEEAAAQGFIAGVNAARKNLQLPEFVLNRDEAYIGVLIDDLVTKGTKEPYRMFTSRAEHRLVLREDNTLDRLLSRAEDLGVAGSEYLNRLNEYSSRRQSLVNRLATEKLYPKADIQTKIVELGSAPLLKSVTFHEFLRRSEIKFSDLEKLGFDGDKDPVVFEAVEIDVKYSGYIKRQKELIQQSSRLESLVLPDKLDYSLIKGLSVEEVEKLSRIKPRTLGQAQRISGVNPSAIQAIMIYIKGNRKVREMAIDYNGEIRGSINIGSVET